MMTFRAYYPVWLSVLCLLVSSGQAARPDGVPTVPGVSTRSSVVGAGVEVLSNFIAANGNTYDYVLLTGTTATVTADPGQITRVLFVDLDDDIVTAEFSGAGTMTVTLDPSGATGPALPLKYNAAVKFGQALNYMKGHASITIIGSNATTNLSVFSVGRATEVDQTMFRDNEVYDGIADISRVTIVADPGNSNFTPFGGLRLSNVSFFAASGVTGISAANVAFNGPVYVGNITAFEIAIPALQLGSASDTRIVGGNLLQDNGRPIQTSGIVNLLFVAGTDSHGRALPAQTNRGVLSQAPVITSRNETTFTTGVAGSFTVTAMGFPAPTFSVASGALPAWATLNATTGVISGTPTSTTPFAFTLQAANGNGTPATQPFFLTVLDPLAISPLANQTVTAGNSATWTASVTGGGSLTYQWRRDGQPIAGATAASYTIAAATMFDAASYDVVVTRGTSQVVSGAATLAVAPTQYPGTMRVDPTFTPSIEADGGAVYAIARQPDGKLVIGGQFARINGVVRSNLARLNADGTVDASFAPGTGVNGTVWKVVLQPDGNILIAGDFVSYNGTTRGHVARVRPNGLLDATFDPGWGANGEVLGLGLQPDGKVLLGGSFSTIDGRPRAKIARLNVNGSVDETFDSGSGAGGAPRAFVFLPDGKILIGGGFEQFNGIGRGGVARLNANGTLDTAFVPDTGGAVGVTSLALQADGKILVGADNFSSPGPTFMRLNADGSRDTSFSPPSAYSTYAMAVQSDGKIVIGGYFSLLNGRLRNHVARFLSDGTLDSSFDAGSAFDFNVRELVLEPDGSVVAGGYFGSTRLARVGASGASDAGFRGTTRVRGTVWDAARQPDGKILLVGAFAYVNDVGCPGIARLLSDGTLDGGFNIGSGPSSSVLTMLALQSDGRILVGGGGFTTFNGVARKYLARLMADGAVDATFDAGSGPDGQLNALVLQPDGRILVGGSFTAFNGTNRSRVARLNPTGAIDTGFNPGAGPDNTVDRIALQADGRILLAGSFTSYSGTGRAKLARIAADGSLDSGFVPVLPAGSSVSGMLALPDGKTVLSVSGTQSLVRLLANGSADSSFTTGNLSTTFYSAGPMLLQADGRLLAGRMLNVSGTFSPAPPGLARLGVSGAVDTTFNVFDLRDAAFSRIILLENGGLIVAGSHFSDGTVDQAGLARLTRATTPAFTSAGSATFVLGAANLFTVTATGLPAPTFSVVSGALPPWAQLDAKTGVISGQPIDATGSPFTFTVQASNGAEAVATQSFTLTVAPGAITVAPLANRIVTAGQSAAWNAVVTGGSSLTYQWRHDGRPIQGATASAYSIATVTMADAGFYDVMVTGETGPSILSAPAVLDVAPTRYPGAMRIDPTFAPVIEATGGTVSSIAQQADGKFIVGGTFSRINGVARRNLARLNANGDVDTSFDPGRGPDKAVHKVLVQPDGKVLLAGDFVSYNGVARGHVARVNADGGLDSSFETGSGADDGIEALALQADGRILVGGWFTSYAGVNRNRILRVNANGGLDSAFNPGAGFSGGVFDLVVQGDGKIVAGGSFVQFDGVACNGVARLLPSGARDVSFVPATVADLDVHVVVVQPDGKILAGADNFSTSPPALLRLNADGSRDSGFSPLSVRAIDAIALQGDGKILIGGPFGSYNGAPRNNLARLTSSGALDATFDAETGIDFHVAAIVLQANGQPVLGGRSLLVEDSPRSAIARVKTTGVLDATFAGDVRSPGSVKASVRQADGKVLIGGFFDHVNGTSHKRLARLNADGSLDLAFNPSVTLVGGVTGASTEVEALAVQDDGRIVLSGFFDRVNGYVRNRVARLLPDGTTDTGFESSASVVGDLSALAVQPDGKVIVFGYFLQSYSAVPRNRLARLNSNGSLDLSFDPKGGLAANSVLFSIVIRPDGRILLGGWFDAYDGVTRHGVVRILSDGSIDSGFGANNGHLTFASGLLLAPDGKIYAGGSDHVTRLNPDGSIDGSYVGATFADIGSVGPMIRQADDRLLVGQANIGTNLPTIGIGRAKADGSRDQTFSVRGVTEARFSGMDLLEDGSLLVSGGTFTDGVISQAGLARFVHVQPATLSVQPQPQTGVVGGAATLSVTATGDGPFTYQWRKGGTAIPGATGSTFSIDVLASGDAGNYTVDVTNLAGTTSSTLAVLTVNPAVPPTIVTQPLSQSVSLGAAFSLRVVPGGSAPFTYQWYLDATPIAGATQGSYTVAAAQASQAGSYTVVVTNIADSVTSGAAVVTILATGFGGTHAVVGPGYAPGQTVTITNTITYVGELTALGWQVLLPEGWSYTAGSNGQAGSAPHVGDTGFLEWAWTTVPASPITFTYSLTVPAGTTGVQTIAALMLPRQSGAQHTLLVKPDPLMLDKIVYHTADTDRDGRLALPELLRVIELYNTRHGTVRTGRYAVDPSNPEDGFANDPARLITDVVTLVKYHSADSNRDGLLDLNELLRVIELYNYRSGTVRTGQYHPQSNTEDSFAPGP